LVFTSNFAATGAGNKTFTLAGSASGEIQGAIVNSAGFTTAVTKSGTGTWTLSGTSSYTGITTISAGVLAVGSLADGGQARSIGQSTNVAGNLVLVIGATLRYVGNGSTTNRLFTVNGTSTGGIATIDASGSGAVSFTNNSAITYSGTANQTR